VSALTETLTIVGLGGSLAHTSRSLAALRIALGGAGEAGAATKLLNLRELDLPILLVTAASLDRA
jgi:hypothetical protein